MLKQNRKRFSFERFYILNFDLRLYVYVESNHRLVVKKEKFAMYNFKLKITSLLHRDYYRLEELPGIAYLFHECDVLT